METAEAVAALDIQGVKLHHLYVAKNTALAEEYFKGKVQTLDMNAYIQLAADFLERIPSDITVQRLVGDTHGNFLISPIWNASKSGITAGITKELERRGSYQGSLYSESKKSLIVIRLHFPFKTHRNGGSEKSKLHTVEI